MIPFRELGCLHDAQSDPGGQALRLVYQIRCGNYFHSDDHRAAYGEGLVLSVVIPFPGGNANTYTGNFCRKALLETQVLSCILNGERGFQCVGNHPEWPPRTAVRALICRFQEIQNGHANNTRVLIR